MLAVFEGEEGPVKDLILHNAALRLWVVEEGTLLVDQVEKADEALRSGVALALLNGLRQPAPVV